MEIEYHVLTGEGRGEEKEPVVKVEVRAANLLDLTAMTPAEVSGPGSLFLETINPVRI